MLPINRNAYLHHINITRVPEDEGDVGSGWRHLPVGPVEGGVSE